MQEQFLTSSAEETEAIGEKIAEQQKNGKLPLFVALYGDLGVGKTAFVRGVARVLCPGAAVRSPTFALVNEYKGDLPIYHFDMYRITDEDELYSIGYDDYLTKKAVILVEWSENIPYALPDHHLKISIEKTSPERPDERLIKIEEKGGQKC